MPDDGKSETLLDVNMVKEFIYVRVQYKTLLYFFQWFLIDCRPIWKNEKES